jgi:epoxyqueuosine reductase
MPGITQTPHQLAQAAKAQAYRLGFTLVGITTAQPPPHGEVFLDWLKHGRHGEMAYLASQRSQQRRLDPRQILPECKSILVVGMPYALPDAAQPEPGFGRVASYAWGADYHEVLAPRLQAFVAALEGLVGTAIPNRWYTDTGPVLERDLAQRAGLGWIGKNTCLINPKAGSYFLLAEVLLGIALEPDPPFSADRCGSCTRCLDACPTACILPDRTLDARRCISYLTIELKGTIPVELRPQVGDWVFGCDICQQVCPWNQRFAVYAPDPGLVQDEAIPSLLEMLAMDAQAFNRRFKNSPFHRPKRRGILRNAAVALGNSVSRENPEVVAALSNAMRQDPEPLVRLHAAWALGQIPGETARQQLRLALDAEKDPGVRLEIEQALARAD